MTTLFLPILLLSPTDGKAAYDAWRRSLATGQTISGLLDIRGESFGDRVWFRMLKPNCLEVTTRQIQVRSDGKIHYTFEPARNVIHIAGPTSRLVGVPSILLGMEAFLNAPSAPTYLGESSSRFAGQDAYAVRVRQKAAAILLERRRVDPRAEIILFFAKRDRKLLGFRFPIGAEVFTGAYRNVRLNDPMASSAFRWEAPGNVKRVLAPDLNDGLPKVGSRLPDFTLSTHDGRRLRLSEYAKGKKAVLVHFWRIGFGDVAEVQKFHERGLRVVGVNAFNDVRPLTIHYTRERLTFPTVLAPRDPSFLSRYGILVCPTQFVVDANLKIVDRFVGEDRARVSKALRYVGPKSVK